MQARITDDLLRLEAGGLNDLRQLVDFAADRFRHRFGRIADRIAATLALEARAEFWRLHRLDDGPIQFADDVLRRARRHPYRVRYRRLVALELRRFRHGWHVGQGVG